jgi:hypothetical protein
VYRDADARGEGRLGGALDAWSEYQEDFILYIDTLEQRNRVLEEQNKKAQALIVAVGGAARNLRSSLDSGIAAVEEVSDELDVEKVVGKEPPSPPE